MGHLGKGKDGGFEVKSKGLERLRRFYDRFVSMRGNPKEIALGFALGLFVGMSPTLGFQMALAVVSAALLGWNKWSAAAGVWITNPITAPFVYGINYWVGSKLILWVFPEATAHGQAMLSRMGPIVQKTPMVMASLILGGVVLGVPVACAGYWLALWAVTRYRLRVKAQMERARQRLREERARRRRHTKAS
ncbi:DUF2062 domain-containing protein [Desulfosoma caldarium]|uniref:DUF2062 domain-containing protein n=1 Tax=Desulfosoma caldarium TaxID=610254 RepID=A0A3N1URG4_9BACT|nr:DUF2062 domain-containing protein [Desulfosoma caldarium]ROQ91157.1 hypothetical protein EDC27_2442 [Desulfosoma caldarium]